VTIQSPFSSRTVILLGAVIVILAAASMLLAAHSGGDSSTRGTIAANGYSHSAIGHAGFFEMLRTLDRPVVRSQRDTLAKVGATGVLVLAEPSFGLSGDSERGKLLSARTILIVLPKWSPSPDENRSDWLGSADLVPMPLVQNLLPAILDHGAVDRIAPTEAVTTSKLAHKPQIEGAIQVIKDSSLTPIVAIGDQILVGEIKRGKQRIWILADPDPIENHGIGKGDNAAFADDLIEALRQPGGTVAFDETIHGFVGSARSPLALLFTFPFDLVGAQALVGIALLLMAATRRFGAPRPTVPQLGAGTASLIANAAHLMEYGGHQATLLSRYAEVCVADAAKRLRAPRGLAGPPLLAWLQRAAKARGAAGDLPALLNDMEQTAPSELVRRLAIARELYFWKREMTHGFD
jgi:hypothetical protein